MMGSNAVIERLRQGLRRAGAPMVPSRLEMIAWAVVCALGEFPRFRTRVIDREKLRQFDNPALGIALALPDDGLTTAVVKRVFSCSFWEFVEAVRRSMAEAKQDKYAPGYHCLAISDLSVYGVTGAIPVVAYPAASTLFVGKPHRGRDGNFFQRSLSFDHRIINGVGAAKFLAKVCSLIGDARIFAAAEPRG
jgi:pyruvate/2-oxoglutarate dehydrogenase complex dihydrolipoamide acyltransferase (E2) component